MQRFADIHSRTAQIYKKHARAWDEHRPRIFFEQSWLDEFIKLLPSAGRVLAVGCGAAEPIADNARDFETPLPESKLDTNGYAANEARCEI